MNSRPPAALPPTQVPVAHRRPADAVSVPADVCLVMPTVKWVDATLSALTMMADPAYAGLFATPAELLVVEDVVALCQQSPDVSPLIPDEPSRLLAAITLLARRFANGTLTAHNYMEDAPIIVLLSCVRDYPFFSHRERQQILSLQDSLRRCPLAALRARAEGREGSFKDIGVFHTSFGQDLDRLQHIILVLSKGQTLPEGGDGDTVTVLRRLQIALNCKYQPTIKQLARCVELVLQLCSDFRQHSPLVVPLLNALSVYPLVPSVHREALRRLLTHLPPLEGEPIGNRTRAWLPERFRHRPPGAAFGLGFSREQRAVFGVSDGNRRGYGASAERQQAGPSPRATAGDSMLSGGSSWHGSQHQTGDMDQGSADVWSTTELATSREGWGGGGGNVTAEGVSDVLSGAGTSFSSGRGGFSVLDD
jgi:hypothetical protein